MATLLTTEQEQVEERERQFESLIPGNVHLMWHGKYRVWIRGSICPMGSNSYMSWRRKGEALPGSGVPLMAFGGLAIGGENFTAKEVAAFSVIYDPNDSFCIFGYTRNHPED